MIYKHSLGFTLIELIIVTVLLGLLAATALPKFLKLRPQAQLAATRAVAGGLEDAVNIAHMQWSRGNTGMQPFALQDGTQIQPSTTGWPEMAACPTCKGILEANGVATSAKCQSVIANVLQNPPPIIGKEMNMNCPLPHADTCPKVCSTGGNCLIAEGSGSGEKALCSYADTNGNVIHYNISTGSVLLKTAQ